MKKQKMRDFTEADIVSAERLYRSTKDPAYIVLAIGANCNEPPFWALIAAQELAKKARSASLSGNDRADLGKKLDAIHRAYFRIYDNQPDRTPSSYKAPSLRSVILAVLGYDGGADISRHEGQLKTLTDVWKKEAVGCEVNFQGNPESPRWHRIILEDGDAESSIPYAAIIENYWKIERVLDAATKHEETRSRKK